MHRGFTRGRGTVDAIFILRRMLEKYNMVEKKLPVVYILFVILAKAYTKKRKMMSWALIKIEVMKRKALTIKEIKCMRILKRHGRKRGLCGLFTD